MKKSWVVGGLLAFAMAGHVFFSTGVQAQQNTPRIPDRDAEIIRELNNRVPTPTPRAEANGGVDQADPAAPESLPLVLTPEQAKTYSELDLEERKAQHEFYQFTIHSARRTFDFHYWSSIVIFFMVLGIVWMGVTLTWKQVTREMEGKAGTSANPKPGGGPGASADPGPETQHQVEIGPKGLKIQSDVVGLMILAVSLGFFYLYLRYVYPISFVQ